MLFDGWLICGVRVIVLDKLLGSWLIVIRLYLCGCINRLVDRFFNRLGDKLVKCPLWQLLFRGFFLGPGFINGFGSTRLLSLNISGLLIGCLQCSSLLFLCAYYTCADNRSIAVKPLVCQN